MIPDEFFLKNIMSTVYIRQSYIIYIHDLFPPCITNITHRMPILHMKYHGVIYYTSHYLFANVSFLNNNWDVEHRLLEREKSSLAHERNSFIHVFIQCQLNKTVSQS